MERNEENEMLKLSEIDVNKCFIEMIRLAFGMDSGKEETDLEPPRYMLTLIVQAKH